MLRGLKKQFLYQAVLLLLVVAAVFSLSLWIASNESVLGAITHYGYWGAFLISIISGFNLVIPVPAASFVPLFLSAGLSLPILILIISVGMTLADFLGYLIGKTGRTALKATKHLPQWARSETWNDKSNFWIGGAVFLYAAFIPLPNELIVIPLALIGHRLTAIAPVLLLGNITFNLIASWGFISLYGVLV